MPRGATREGLPDDEHYAPEEIGTAELAAGEPVQTWEEWGLEMVPVKCDGADTGRRLIRQNGDYVDSVTDNYKLLPNERAVEAANQAADELGAQPFNEFEGDWFVELDNHVYQDSDRHRVHACYSWETRTVAPGDNVEYGFAVHNSIDGSLGFNVALFTFRHACANMVHIGTTGAREDFALGVENEREVLVQESRAHTKGLEVDVESLVGRIEDALTWVDTVDEAYREWVQEVLTETQVSRLLERAERGRLAYDDLPDWMNELRKDLDSFEDDDEMPGQEFTPEDRAQLISAQIPSGENVWDTYNDLTEAIWHSGSSNDQSKMEKNKDVHRALEIAPGVR